MESAGDYIEVLRRLFVAIDRSAFIGDARDFAATRRGVRRRDLITTELRWQESS